MTLVFDGGLLKKNFDSFDIEMRAAKADGSYIRRRKRAADPSLGLIKSLFAIFVSQGLRGSQLIHSVFQVDYIQSDKKESREIMQKLFIIPCDLL